MKLGIISDTHGQIHPHVFNHLEGCDLILHAGDVGTEEVLVELETIAPVKAVYGNVDSFPIVGKCQETEILELHDKKIYMAHIVMAGDRFVPKVAEEIMSVKPDLVVFGHTHEQHTESIDGILFFNPGSGGQRRPGKRLGVGLIYLENGIIEHETFYLDENISSFTFK